MKKFIVFVCISFIACKDTNKLSKEATLLIDIVFSETFAEKFHICDKVANEIFIYNNTDAFQGLNFNIDNYCEKTIQLLEFNIEKEVEVPFKDFPGILLQEFLKTSSTIQFTFIQIETNLTLKYIYDANYKLVKILQNFY